MASNFSATHCHALAKRPLTRPEITRLTMGGQGQQLIWVGKHGAAGQLVAMREAGESYSEPSRTPSNADQLVQLPEQKGECEFDYDHQHKVYELHPRGRDSLAGQVGSR